MRLAGVSSQYRHVVDALVELLTLGRAGVDLKVVGISMDTETHG